MYYYSGNTYKDIMDMPIHRFRDLLLWRMDLQEKLNAKASDSAETISKVKKRYSFGSPV